MFPCRTRLRFILYQRNRDHQTQKNTNPFLKIKKMKRLLFATILLVALASTTTASAKNTNNKLLVDLTTAMKQAHDVSVKTTDIFKKVSFTFGNKKINAFYDLASNDFLGYAVPISITDIPEGGAANIAKKYNGWSADCAIAYITSSGNTEYYVTLKKPGKQQFAVQISPNGKASYYTDMPYYQP